jgi:hypothetical protein
MRNFIIPVALALAPFLAVNGFAQSRGEADPAGAKAIPVKPATAAEKAQAKANRKVEGAAAAREDSLAAQESRRVMGNTRVFSQEERKAAAKARKARAQEALKKGEIPSGEK